VDILADGSLDYPDELLRELDYTVCSIHSRFALGCEAQTERILRAMDNRYFTILGARRATAAGVLISISTDSHSTREVDLIRCGIDGACAGLGTPGSEPPAVDKARRLFGDRDFCSPFMRHC
jgi:histidinol phosphatase-like PHP family hydrolase